MGFVFCFVLYCWSVMFDLKKVVFLFFVFIFNVLVVLLYICLVRVGDPGWSVFAASTTSRWKQPRFCCWSGLSFLWRCWEASQWYHQSSVSIKVPSFSHSLTHTHIIIFDFLFSWMVCFWILWVEYKEFFLYRDQQSVDFKRVDAHVHQLKGSSARYTLIFLAQFFIFYIWLLLLQTTPLQFDLHLNCWFLVP